MGDESFQSVTCTGTDTQTRATDRQNTDKHEKMQRRKWL